MRAISQSISALLLGCSSFALSNTALADSGITLVYSTGSHVAYPYDIGSRHYAPRVLQRHAGCALPYRADTHSHHHHKRSHDHRHEVRWIDRHGYHHRDSHRHDDKRRDRRRHENKYRHDDHQSGHRKPRRDHGRSRTHMTYNSNGQPW